MPAKLVIKRRSKYGNRRVKVDGVWFDSKREANRWGELCVLAVAGEIADLQCQVAYPLIVNGVIIGKYVCDFQYTQHGQTVVEDVKGVKTAIYRRSKKHMAAQYGIEIREV